jgi:glycolate oxidase FAD binding subunit
MREEFPTTENDVACVLRSANEEGLAVLPRGGGTKQDWGNPPTRADVVLSTTQLNRVLEHAWADLTVTVEAGCTVAKLQKCLAQYGQRLAIDALWPEQATIGGILSTNDSGALRLAYGSLRDLVIGITLVLADGTTARSGGKVVKNVAGYDIPKLTTGAMGTLGVITQATFRLHPLPRNRRTLSASADNVDRAQALLLVIQAERLAVASLQARFGSGMEPQIDVLLEGTEAGIASEEAKLARIAPFTEISSDVWGTRQEIASAPLPRSVAKVSVLPSHIERTMALLPYKAAVFQSTGIGWVISEEPLENLRPDVEREGGSLMILRGPRTDAWGNAGDALPLMRTLKQQFDPKGTLNPGRFLRSI